MTVVPGAARPIVSLAEAKAFLRLESEGEDALLAGLIRTASALCEAFLNQVVLAREFVERRTGGEGWLTLAVQPVRSITAVHLLQLDGTAVTLPADQYALWIDPDGRAAVQTPVSRSGQIEVHGAAGLADNMSDVPEPLRQGVLRLVAHLFTARDGGGGEPPAAVTALWRPYRRLRVA